jgi:hypothetical protein
MAGRAHALDQARIPEARVLGLGMVEVVGLVLGASWQTRHTESRSRT